MATIRKRGGKFQAILRRGHHSQAKTFAKRADAEHWAKRLEIEIERNVATKKDRRKGRPSLGKTHNAVQHCAIRQKRQLCVRFKVIYCLAVAAFSKL